MISSSSGLKALVGGMMDGVSGIRVESDIGIMAGEQSTLPYTGSVVEPKIGELNDPWHMWGSASLQELQVTFWLFSSVVQSRLVGNK